MDWLQRFAPPEAAGMTFSEAGPVPARGHIARQIFWYTTFTADMIADGLPVVNADGTPKWRMAPSPYGPYWEEGMKLGYQDAGSWTLLSSTPLERSMPGDCAPRLNPEEDPEVWFARAGAPKPKLADEKPPGQTVPYDDLIDAWRAGRVR